MVLDVSGETLEASKVIFETPGKIRVSSVFHPWLKIDCPILIHTVFKYAGSARLTGKSGGCGIFHTLAPKTICVNFKP